MEITGYDYEIISNISYNEMMPKFKIGLKKIWENAFVEEIEKIDNEKLWVFFAEDEEMNREDTGYELNEKGEGCFSIITTKVALVDQVCAVINADREILREVRLIQPDIWYYSLILPDVIENSQFSKKIYELVRTAISDGHRDDTTSVFEQRSVQFYIDN